MTGARSDWLYVKDHCRAMKRVLEVGTVGEVYNIGGHNERTNLEVVETVCSLLDALVPDSLMRRTRRSSCRGPARPRQALRHRRYQDRARARLETR